MTDWRRLLELIVGIVLGGLLTAALIVWWASGWDWSLAWW
jgi:hypothetical protein